MARRGWGVSIATAIGVAAGAGAAQLGFGYGLGVITWTPTDAGAADTAWADGLAWATWLAASSTVLGAVCAQRLHQRPAPTPAVHTPAATDGPHGPEPAASDTGTPAAATAPTTVDRRPVRTGAAPGEHGGLLGRVAIALGAGLGGLVTVLLVAVPARVAVGADTAAPQRVAAVHTALGIVIGVLVALWALRSRAAAVNVTATAAWLWLLAVVSVIDGVRVGRGLVGAQLGTWQLDPDHSRYWIGDQLYWPGALLALVPALVIGALAARRATRSPGHRVSATASGAAGPLLVALAYLSTVPRWSTLGPEQLSTQLVAPYAVIAGIGGSVLAAVLGERAERHRAASPGTRDTGTPPEPTAQPVPSTEPDPAAQPDPAARSGSAAEPGSVAQPGSAARSGSAAEPGPAAQPGPALAAAGRTSTSAGGTGSSTSGTSTDAAPRRSRTDRTAARPRPGDETAAPRVPAPRTEPDLPARSDTASQEPAPGNRRSRRPTNPPTS
ncbi:hypothetical protein ABZS77_01200 [Micromonospora sp. NPDC005298]|uniref:hypothetical protein n=1 Tax=Micromonospora sp. NPDC005298 TaxID=3156873 RepID=UPI0033AC91DB